MQQSDVHDPQAVPVNSENLYLDAAYFVACLLTEVAFQIEQNDLTSVQATSLLSAINQYKVQKDDSKTNTRRTTSDFMVNVMDDLRKKFNITRESPAGYKFAEQSKLEGSIPAKEGLFYAYNLFAMLMHVLNGQHVTKDAKIESSEFIRTLLNTLSPLFQKGAMNLKTRIKPLAAASKKHADEKRHILDDLALTAKGFLVYFEQLNHSIQQVIESHASQAVQTLFDYCAEKEDDHVSRKRPEKREKIYAILRAYFTAQSSDDFVHVFKHIAEGIQLSRSEGKNKEASRGAEHALVAFRDELYQAIFVNQNSNSLLKFTTEQLHAILNSISYRAENGDVDVSRHAMDLIDCIERQTGVNQNALRLAHIRRLVLEIPDEVNGSKIDKAQYCFDKGSVWGQAITSIMENPRTTFDQLKEVCVCGYVWNHYIEQKGGGEEFTTPQQYMAFEDIVNHPLLPKEFKKPLQEFCQTLIAKIQAKRAVIERAKLAESLTEVGFADGLTEILSGNVSPSMFSPARKNQTETRPLPEFITPVTGSTASRLSRHSGEGK